MLQVDGYLVAVYNLGQQDIVVKDSSIRVNDGQYHVVKFIRTGVNSTLQIDDNQVSEESLCPLYCSDKHSAAIYLCIRAHFPHTSKQSFRIKV